MTGPGDGAERSSTPQGEPHRPRVVVLFGGRSSEHKISCLSAGSVLAHLDRERYDVLPVGITPAGAWVLGPTDPAELRLRGRELPEVTSGRPVALPADTRRELVALDDGASLGRVDVVVPVLHGPGGEDGTVQGLLESAGVPYVGAGVLASAASMDKDVTKRLLRDAGLAVGDAVVLTPDRPGGTDLTAAERERLGLPVFVKPARAGSSVGITRVTDWAGLDAAIATARREDPKVLVEAAIVGREIECGVLEHPDGRVEASVPAEIRVVGGDAGWYDFDTKYLDDACELDVPAKLDDEVAETVRTRAIEVFRTMGVEGLARVDFFLTGDVETQRSGARPSWRLLVNELNTMPGFTATSLYPRMWATAGIDYPTLLTTLVETALNGSRARS
ncbi:D-alanine--D-alanine ligase family protein [Actinomycetospora lemnae]|uniref:D-alanine--D-alanine ligase n=1 Tax=Actinomycetospora lemnae TaxID=3019891 RepID=A0ABT5SNI6_9PSEU|nr:D-alanine--D-alanine ligase family protein [Actinomycetospora sp. DW7H6]MDD7964407.1 D-alanine--D-alanine ligase [Actinomycetospora sp. DW7H6]